MKTDKNMKIQEICVYIYSCLSLLCITGCTNEENNHYEVEKYCPLAIGSVTLDMDETHSRSVTELGKDAVIGIFATNASGVSAYTPRYNVPYTNDGTSWSSSNPVVLGVENAAISAYHPYKAGDMSTTVLSLASQEYSAEADISYAKAQNRNSTSIASAAIDFTMLRAYSQIEFTLNRADTYTGSFKITKIGIKNSGIVGTGTLDVEKDAYTRTLNSDFSYNPANGTGIGGGKEKTLTSSVLMVPPVSAPTGKFTISLTIDDITSTIDINALALKAGTRYKVTIKVEGKHELTVSQVTIEDWVEVPNDTEYPI